MPAAGPAARHHGVRRRAAGSRGQTGSIGDGPRSTVTSTWSARSGMPDAGATAASTEIRPAGSIVASARRAAASSPPSPAGSSTGPRFQATRIPAGRRSGSACSTRSASDPTARAVTAGQRPRSARLAASDSDRAASATTRSPRSIASMAVVRNPTFLPIESIRSARSAGRAAASGMPGKPPPLPRSTNRSIARPRRTASPVRLSTTWRIAISPGSRIAVRLIAPVQASRSRTCPSIAARASGSRTSPSAASPASSAS